MASSPLSLTCSKVVMPKGQLLLECHIQRFPCEMPPPPPRFRVQS